jgi:hypothetical protein
MLPSMNVCKLRNYAGENESRHAFRQQPFVMAPKIWDQKVVHQFSYEKGHKSDSEGDPQDKSPRTRLNPRCSPN